MISGATRFARAHPFVTFISATTVSLVPEPMEPSACQPTKVNVKRSEQPLCTPHAGARQISDARADTWELTTHRVQLPPKQQSLERTVEGAGSLHLGRPVPCKPFKIAFCSLESRKPIRLAVMSAGRRESSEQRFLPARACPLLWSRQGCQRLHCAHGHDEQL